MEKTADQLQQELETALADLKTATAERDVAVSKLSIAETALNEKQAELTDALAVNDSLTLEIEKISEGKAMPGEVKKIKEKPVDHREHSFVNGGDTYGFNYPVQTFNKQRITPIEVAASEELQNALITSKNSMIFKKGGAVNADAPKAKKTKAKKEDTTK